MKWWTCETNGVTDVGRVICCQLKYLRPFSALFASVARRVCLRSGVKTWRKEKKKKRTEEYENKLTEERERERERKTRFKFFFRRTDCYLRWRRGGKNRRKETQRRTRERKRGTTFCPPSCEIFFFLLPYFFLLFRKRHSSTHTHVKAERAIAAWKREGERRDQKETCSTKDWERRDRDQNEEETEAKTKTEEPKKNTVAVVVLTGAPYLLLANVVRHGWRHVADWRWWIFRQQLLLWDASAAFHHLRFELFAATERVTAAARSFFLPPACLPSFSPSSQYRLPRLHRSLIVVSPFYTIHQRYQTWFEKKIFPLMYF